MRPCAQPVQLRAPRSLGRAGYGARLRGGRPRWPERPCDWLELRGRLARAGLYSLRDVSVEGGAAAGYEAADVPSPAPREPHGPVWGGRRHRHPRCFRWEHGRPFVPSPRRASGGLHLWCRWARRTLEYFTNFHSNPRLSASVPTQGYFRDSVGISPGNVALRREEIAREGPSFKQRKLEINCDVLIFLYTVTETSVTSAQNSKSDSPTEERQGP